MAQAQTIERVIGVSLLNPQAYESVEHDESATGTALAIVVLASIANGIGMWRETGLLGAIVGVIFAVIGFVLYAGIAYLIGGKLFATAETRATWGQLLRTLGFAQAPGILRVLGVIPVIGGLVGFVVWIWILVATVIAIRHACDFSTGRAIATAVVSSIVYFIFVVVPMTIMGAVVGAVAS